MLTNEFIKNLSCDISTTTASLSEVSPTASTPVCPENQFWGVPQYTTCGVLSYYYCCEKPEQVIYMPDPTIVDEPAMRPVFNVCKVSTDCAAWTSPGCKCSQGKIKNQKIWKRSILNVQLTHIGKLSGNDSGDFPETFSKKIFCCIVTSLRTIIERGHVASTGGGLVHLDMISRQTSYPTR